MRLGLICLTGQLLAAISAGQEALAERPNVLLILLDDAGWTDLGCYGSQIETPQIDRLAENGIRFTDCHAAAPNCSPSRAGLLTGRIPARTGIYSYIPPQHPMHLPADEVTLAELLKPEGYATGHFGKWHLSSLELADQPQPREQGFDYSLGTSNNARPSHRNPRNFVRNGQALGEVEGFSCDIVASEFTRWVNTVPQDQPFFACVWFHEPHTPIASPEELIAKYQELYPDISRRQATYFANIENVDRAVGKIVATLQGQSRWDNTLLFLTSDNGGLNPWSNQGLRGRKSFLYEGGQREPGILHWPAGVQGGKVIKTPISHLDILPTICELTSARTPQGRHLDGQSLVPLLAGDRFERQQPLFWFFYRVQPAAAVREGDWVLLGYFDDPVRKHTHWLSQPDWKTIEEATFDRFELYNLRNDREQKHDLATAHPERVEQLRAKLERLRADVVEEGDRWDLSDYRR